MLFASPTIAAPSPLSIRRTRGSRFSLARLNNLHLAINLAINLIGMTIDLRALADPPAGVIITFDIGFKASATKMC